MKGGWMCTASEAWRGCIPFKSSDTSEQSAHFQHQLSVSQGSLPKTCCCCCCFCCCCGCWSVISMSFHQCESTALMLMLRMRLECGLMFHLCITDPLASRKVSRTYSSLPWICVGYRQEGGGVELKDCLSIT